MEALVGLQGNLNDGRYAKVPIKAMKVAFKTPALRDVSRTAPYMRNVAYRTLAEVVEHYDRGGDEKDNLDPNIKPLNLTSQEKRDLVAFMESLTSKQMSVSLPKFPE